MLAMCCGDFLQPHGCCCSCTAALPSLKQQQASLEALYCAHLSASVPVSCRVISPPGWNMLVMKEEEMPTRDWPDGSSSSSSRMQNPC